MSKEQITALSPLALFRHVFGFKEGQTLTDFATECKDVKGDEKFVSEVRDFALASVS